MAYYIFSEDDLLSIEAARLDEADTWSSNAISNLKRKIKDHIRQELREKCCYCRRSTRDEFAMVLDIEHILPKHEYDEFMFEVQNLSVACKRCNMQIKGADLSFISPEADMLITPFLSDNYLLIHPNLDNYYEHIEVLSVRQNDNELILYSTINDSEKGIYTYNYFRLYNLEVRSFDKVQGIVEDDDFDMFAQETIASIRAQLEIEAI